MDELGIFQDKLKDLFENTVFGDQILLKTKDGKAVTIKGYSQNLPIKTTDGETTDDALQYDAQMPYFILRIDTGDLEPLEPKIVDWQLYFGVYDNDPNNQGHRYVLTLIGRAADYLQQHSLLLNQAYVKQDEPKHFILPDEDTWPYFFGMLEFKTELRSKGVEDDNI